jgi:hypothetical protein
MEILQILVWRRMSGLLRGLTLEINGYPPNLWIYLWQAFFELLPRSESANSFFNRFIHRRLALVEFWLRFDTALECQRQEELMADNRSIHTTPQLLTPWKMEKQGSEVFTYEVFVKFQQQIIIARDHCCVQGITQGDGVKIVSMRGGAGKVREVCYDTATKIANCSCKLFESNGIPCRHIIQVLRIENEDELPSYYLLKRWQKRCKR